MTSKAAAAERAAVVGYLKQKARLWLDGSHEAESDSVTSQRCMARVDVLEVMAAAIGNGVHVAAAKVEGGHSASNE